MKTPTQPRTAARKARTASDAALSQTEVAARKDGSIIEQGARSGATFTLRRVGARYGEHILAAVDIRSAGSEQVAAAYELAAWLERNRDGRKWCISVEANDGRVLIEADRHGPVEVEEHTGFLKAGLLAIGVR